MTVLNLHCGGKILWLCLLSLFVGDSGKKAPVPDATAQAEATKLIKEVYGDEWTAAQTTEQKQALAKKLIQKAHESQSDRVDYFVLLRLARDIATQAIDGPTAFEAIENMDKTFQIDALEMKVSVLTGAVPTTAEQHQAIAEEATEVSKEAVAKDSFVVARQLNELASNEAKKAKDAALLNEVVERKAEIEEFAKAFESVKTALATLENSRTEPEANFIVGRYRCFLKGNWDSGLPMLALGSDKTLKQLAAKDIQGATTSDERARLGDSWWGFAESEKGTSKMQIQRRARFWYEQALPGLAGLAKDKVEKRLQQLAETDAKRFTSHESLWIDLLAQVDVRRDSIRGKWARTKDGVVIRQSDSDSAQLALPLVLPTNYDLEVNFTRFEGDNDVSVMIPVGENHCLCVLSAYHGELSGLGFVNGKAAKDNVTTVKPGTLLNNRRYSLRVNVTLKDSDRTADVVVTLDGRPYISYKGPPNALSVAPQTLWRTPQPGVSLLCAQLSGVIYHSVRVRDTAERTSQLRRIDLVGDWIWFRGNLVTFSPDGTMKRPDNGDHGKWTLLRKLGREYEIVWSNGFVDHAVLSADGSTMNCRNNLGHDYSVNRK